MKAWVFPAVFIHLVFGLAWVFSWPAMVVMIALMLGIGGVMLLVPGRPPEGYCRKCEEPVTECKCWLGEVKPQNTQNTRKGL